MHIRQKQRTLSGSSPVMLSITCAPVSDSPVFFVTYTDGILTVPTSSGSAAMVISSSDSTAPYTTTAAAPAACAFKIFLKKSQLPRRIITILPEHNALVAGRPATFAGSKLAQLGGGLFKSTHPLTGWHASTGALHTTSDSIPSSGSFGPNPAVTWSKGPIPRGSSTTTERAAGTPHTAAAAAAAIAAANRIPQIPQLNPAPASSHQLFTPTPSARRFESPRPAVRAPASSSHSHSYTGPPQCSSATRTRSHRPALRPRCMQSLR